MQLIAPDGVGRKESTLLLCGELHRAHGVGAEGVVQEEVLEAFILSDIVIVWDVDTKWTTVGGESDHLKSSKVWCQEVVFLHLFWPW